MSDTCTSKLETWIYLDIPVAYRVSSFKFPVSLSNSDTTPLKILGPGFSKNVILKSIPGPGKDIVS